MRICNHPDNFDNFDYFDNFELKENLLEMFNDYLDEFDIYK